ncbi:MAG: tRNA lysidine(34) synthetase TilS [Clostridia bacterium]|nr:tRNA lysidine(34) synthetase TilS [Clostridia bacterium]
MVKTLELSTEILKGKIIAVAVSGGRDSMALLHLFSKSDCNFFVVNLEHGIRGESSKRDSKFVQDFCTFNNIKFKSFSVDALSFAKENHKTVEQSARELRYQIFNQLLVSGECDFVALAHHQDDQAETILMRILRGTGLKGLRGIETLHDGYFRPLLNFSRSDINAYVKTNQIPYIDDETNNETDANRNFLRLEILPLIEKRYPAYRQTLSRLARNASEAEEYISNCARPVVKFSENAVRIVMPFPPLAIFKCEVMQGANALGIFQDIEECHFTALFNLQTAETAKQISLAHGLVAIKEPNSILLALEANFDSKKTVLFSELRFPSEINGCLFSHKLKPYTGEKLEVGELIFDLEKLPQSAILRYRDEGDQFTKFGGGTKSLGDFFTDRKIPLWERNRILVCADGNDILFIAGVEISDKIKVTNETTNIIKITKEKL